MIKGVLIIIIVMVLSILGIVYLWKDIDVKKDILQPIAESREGGQ